MAINLAALSSSVTPTGVRRTRLTYLLLAILTMLAVAHIAAASLSLLATDGLERDTAAFGEMARLQLRGGQIYRDLSDNKPPGIFIFLMPFVALLGNSTVALHVGAIAVNLLAALAIAFTLWQLTMSRLIALGAALLALLYAVTLMKPETTVLMSAFGAASFGCVIAARGRWLLLLTGGLLFVCGLVAKQPLIIELPALILVTWTFAPATNRFKSLLRLLAGLMLGVSVVTFLAVYSGIAGAMWNDIITPIGRYVFTADGSWHFDSNTGGIQLNGKLWEKTIPQYAMVLLAAAAAMVVYARRGDKNRLAVMLFWLALTFAGSLTGREMKPAYFFQILPPLLAIIGLGLTQIKHLKSEGAVILLIIAIVALEAYSARFMQPISPHIPTWIAYDDATIEFINSHIPEDDCLWTWGYLNGLNYWSNRRSCTSALYDEQLVVDRFFPTRQNQQEHIRELIEANPTYLIMSSQRGFFTRLQRYVERYVVVEDIAEYVGPYVVFAVDRSMWHKTDANFGGEIRLIGYDLLPVDSPVCAGDRLKLAMTWEQISPPAHQYQMFVQLLTPDETARVAGYDGPPEDDDNATNTWVDTGEIRLGEHFDMPIDADAAPGPYKLVVGLYDVETAERVPVLDASGAPIGSYAVLQNVEVSACD